MRGDAMSNAGKKYKSRPSDCIALADEVGIVTTKAIEMVGGSSKIRKKLKKGQTFFVKFKNGKITTGFKK